MAKVDINTSPETGGKFMIFHGDDFPSGLDRAAEEGKIISGFNLASLMVRGLVEIKFHEHETMIPKHVRAIEVIIGAY